MNESKRREVDEGMNIDVSSVCHGFMGEVVRVGVGEGWAER